MVAPAAIATAVATVCSTLASVLALAPTHVFSAVTRQGRVAAWEFARLATAITVMHNITSADVIDDSEDDISAVAVVMMAVINDNPRFVSVGKCIANIKFVRDYPDLRLDDVVEYCKHFCLLPDCSKITKSSAVKLLLYAQVVFWHERPAVKSYSPFDYEDDVRPSYMDNVELNKAYSAAHDKVSVDGLPTLQVPWESLSIVYIAKGHGITWVSFLTDMYHGSGRLGDPRLSEFLKNYSHTAVLSDAPS